MARVLFLTQVLPYPLDSGAKIRQYHMLQYLSQQHDITLASFVRAENRPEEAEHLRRFCRAVHTVPIKRSRWRDGLALVESVWSGLPAVIARDGDGEMRRLLVALCSDTFDVVHADQISMAQYGLFAAQVQRNRPKTIIDMHNAMYLVLERIAQQEQRLLQRALTRREARAMAHYEAFVCHTYDAALTVTQEDRDYLLALYPEADRAGLAARFTPIPICIDPSRTAPVVRRQGPPTILHLGTMFWPPNVQGVLWFAREVLPLIHAQQPDAHFVVIGKDPPAEVRDLAADSRIEVTGYVADPTPYLEAAYAFIVPLHSAGGMRVKILDAWLWGLPIVATPIGAEGIQVEDGENILIAADAASFAAATLRLLTDDQLNERLRRQGRSWVETHYSWQVVYRQVEEVYTSLPQCQAVRTGTKC